VLINGSLFFFFLFLLYGLLNALGFFVVNLPVLNFFASPLVSVFFLFHVKTEFCAVRLEFFRHLFENASHKAESDS
jgi:hypothetical protein